MTRLLLCSLLLIACAITADAIKAKAFNPVEQTDSDCNQELSINRNHELSPSTYCWNTRLSNTSSKTGSTRVACSTTSTVSDWVITEYEGTTSCGAGGTVVLNVRGNISTCVRTSSSTDPTDPVWFQVDCGFCNDVDCLCEQICNVKCNSLQECSVEPNTAKCECSLTASAATAISFVVLINCGFVLGIFFCYTIRWCPYYKRTPGMVSVVGWLLVIVSTSALILGGVAGADNIVAVGAPMLFLGFLLLGTDRARLRMRDYYVRDFYRRK